jgi:hypothetical protein
MCFSRALLAPDGFEQLLISLTTPHVIPLFPTASTEGRIDEPAAAVKKRALHRNDPPLIMAAPHRCPAASD